MKVLIACEESQRGCIAFRERGYEAYSCDIQDCSGGHPEWHIKADALEVIRGGTVTTCDGLRHNIGKWDLLIAHPPCTYMTAASACRMYPRKGVLDTERLRKALEAKAFFDSLLDAPCERIAVENPVPLKCVGLPKETQRIEPWEYALDESEYYTKRTYLWLKGLPKLVPIRVVKPDGVVPFVNAGSKRADGTARVRVGTRHTAKERSKTFLGIAAAMAEQWGVL